jgi:ribosome-binding protein aMBF1 (putative translation factor)
MRRICRWLICATIAPSNLPPQRPKRHIQPVALKEKAVGVVLREFREQAGQSQETLSAECGFDRTYISRVERGIINPTISRLWKIADALDTSLSQIVKRMESWIAEGGPRG